MTDREAITMLKGCACTLVMRRAINKGISALQEREERSNGCEFCCTEYVREDWRDGNAQSEYIEREAALKICQKEYEERLKMYDYSGNTVAWNIVNEIKSLPAADVTSARHGEWINREGPDENGNVTEWCSRCGHGDTHSPKIKVPHCWFCGAKMDGGEEHGPTD